ncbi:MAG TPA: SDR family oxidoreductase [Streptosporangiaceae bacterium]|nr:SDR family oxidoreductase [Streptosporangiaceae bacterium]
MAESGAVPRNGAIVSGNAEGLGYAVAGELCRCGKTVVLLDDDPDGLSAFAAGVRGNGGDILPLTVDFASAASVREAAAAAIDHLGVPRFVVHNAAVLTGRPIGDWQFGHWKREVDVVLQAAFVLSKAVWPLLLEAGAGSLLYVSSGSAIAGFAGEAAYGPAKHGQEGLMKVLALEGRARNIAVNTITPGAPIDGPLAHTYSEAERRIMVKPQVLAPAFRFLSEIDASYSTGNRLSAYQIAQVLAVGSAPGATGG